MKRRKHRVVDNFTKEQIASIIDDYCRGISVQKISKRFNVSGDPIKKVLQNNNIPIRHKKAGLCTEQVKQIIIEYQSSNISCATLGKKYNVDSSLITYYLKKNKIKTRTPNLIKCDHTFFEEINTPAKAYFLGLMYADGCVLGYNKSSQPSLSIGLVASDKDILFKFKDVLKYEGGIRFISPTKYHYSQNESWRKNVKDQCSLRITSRKLCDSLVSLGCVPRKSLILEFPKKDQVPENLMNHFMRGLFDGDGCIREDIKNRKIPCFTFDICGTLSICEGVKNHLDTVLDLRVGNNIRRKTENGCFGVYYSGYENIRKIYNYLYKDAGDIFLTRKEEKMRKCFKYVSIRDNKTSIYKRVSFDKRKSAWSARIERLGKVYFVGSFKTELQAYLALCKYEQENGFKFSNNPKKYFEFIESSSLPLQETSGSIH